MDDERVLRAGHPSHAKDLGYHVLCWLFAPLVFPLLMSLARYLQTRFTRFEITSERIRITVGVFSRHMEELELYRVKDTSVSEPFLLRVVFKLGHLVLRTSDASNPLLVIPAVADVHELREELRGFVEKIRASKGVREVDFGAESAARFCFRPR
jgi:uncharacterized membrane protein YdbT with pleckstrin-like domain